MRQKRYTWGQRLLIAVILVMAGIQQSQAQEELLKKAADKAVSTVKTIVGDSARTIVIDDSLKTIIGEQLPTVKMLTLHSQNR